MVTKKTNQPAVRRPAVRGAGAKKARNIWRELSAIGASIPPAQLRALPRDGARNLDHYLDGSPKED